MDRISALRNIEEALSEFESGEIDLVTMEERVRGILRTYATEFEDGRPYRANGSPSVDGLIVVADSPREAREQIRDLTDDAGRFDVEPIE